MSYEVHVIVNGNRCKQYPHNGKLFIEAKRGSEYSIEVKNNSYQRILVVSSVDGLDVLNGKPAKEDGNGYVVDGYGSIKIDGFRVSDEKVAKFLFDYKGSSYATSKEDGSERNVGVVGVRIFSEKVKTPPVTIREEHHHHHHHDHYPNNPPVWPKKPWTNPWGTPWSNDNTTIWCGGLTGDVYNTGDITKCCDNSGPVLYSCDNIPTKGGPSAPSSPKASLGNPMRSCSFSLMNASMQNKGAEALGFDMGTKWGESKESRVREVEFEKGVLILTTSIYYASRQSLIEMGVPIGNEKQVSFPEPFDDGKYAKPPQGWQG